MSLIKTSLLDFCDKKRMSILNEKINNTYKPYSYISVSEKFLDDVYRCFNGCSLTVYQLRRMLGYTRYDRSAGYAFLRKALLVLEEKELIIKEKNVVPSTWRKTL